MQPYCGLSLAAETLGVSKARRTHMLGEDLPAESDDTINVETAMRWVQEDVAPRPRAGVEVDGKTLLGVRISA